MKNKWNEIRKKGEVAEVILDLPGIQISVHGNIHTPKRWFMSCRELCISNHMLGGKITDLEVAKLAALKVINANVSNLAEAVSAAYETESMSDSIK